MITKIDSGVGMIWEYAKSRQWGKVIDLGGGDNCFVQAETVVDLNNPHNGKKWIRADLCDTRWADEFPDKSFDMVFCNHTLEDIRDPIGVLRQIVRIGKSALIGTPHWSKELSVCSVRDDWEAISGWPHHRWLVGINKNTGCYEFMAKQCWTARGDYPLKEHNLNLHWDGGVDFEFAEITNLYTLHSKRDSLIHWLEERWL